MFIELIPFSEHLRFNKYVLGHYRPATNWIGCIKSLLYFHNETINILTHGESAFMDLVVVIDIATVDVDIVCGAVPK